MSDQRGAASVTLDTIIAPVYLYRLNVAVPEGFDAPNDWEEICEKHGWYDKDYGYESCPPFSLPRRRLYLSKYAAEKRAALLREFGATVTITRGSVAFEEAS